MAYSVTKCDVGGSTFNGYHYEFLCESADDIADLPTGASSTEISRPAPGSLAFVETDSSARYILKNSREWGEYPMAGGGGSTGGGVMQVTVAYDEAEDTFTLDKTWQEIYDFITGGGVVYLLRVVDSDTESYFASTVKSDTHSVLFVGFSTDATPFITEFAAASADGYPVMVQ